MRLKWIFWFAKTLLKNPFSVELKLTDFLFIHCREAVPFQLKYCFLGDKITKKRVLLYLKTVFFGKNDVLVPCASKIENNTKYMYLVLDEKQLNAQRHVLCTWNENLGFARPSVTYEVHSASWSQGYLLQTITPHLKGSWMVVCFSHIKYLEIVKIWYQQLEALGAGVPLDSGFGILFGNSVFQKNRVKSRNPEWNPGFPIKIPSLQTF